MFCKNVVSNFPALFKIECAAAKFSKIKLVVYQFAFCCFFFWGNGYLFKRSILVSLFGVDFRRTLKHFLNFNTDQSVSTVLIKYIYILFTCKDFDHLFFEKVCSDLIKLSLFCFFFLQLFFISFRFFVSFVFSSVRTISPKALGLWLELVGSFPRGQLCSRTVFTGGKKEIFYMPTKC